MDKLVEFKVRTWSEGLEVRLVIDDIEHHFKIRYDDLVPIIHDLLGETELLERMENYNRKKLLDVMKIKP